MLKDDKSVRGWVRDRIKPEQIEKYLHNGRDFIDESAIERALASNPGCDAQRVRDILAKSLAIETLTPDETACLLNVTDPELLTEMRQAAAAVKKKVYDNRIVTFAPLFVITGIVGVIIAYVKRGDARGSWVASHFDWLIGTFWWSLLWDLVALVVGVLLFWVLGLGILLAILILAATSIWVIYRVVRGYLAFKDSQPLPA